MISKWSSLKPEAVRLRKQGKSLPYVHAKLGIPKSTLSYWFKDIVLTPNQYKKLERSWKDALIKARKGAVKWHNEQKQIRLKLAKQQASNTLARIDTNERSILELSLAILYLAEGSKKNVETAIGSSDPLTLRFFLQAVDDLYDLKRKTIRCELYLRADHKPDKVIVYWSKQLAIPKENFKQINIDKRSIGKASYPDYRGVCSLRCGTVAIQRRLVYLSQEYFAIIGKQKNGARLAQLVERPHDMR